ncbi:MAG: hypothetical protein KME31_22585 [Tolypothrix carrinoi HA7290-LM1]|nr:hypothetical protein [Tolypothrix carrinoi HA7290-LM1]
MGSGEWGTRRTRRTRGQGDKVTMRIILSPPLPLPPSPPLPLSPSPPLPLPPSPHLYDKRTNLESAI